MSMYGVAKSVGLPAAFVELRHQATHEELPPLLKLRNASKKALDWIWDYYWSQLSDPTDCPPGKSPEEASAKQEGKEAQKFKSKDEDNTKQSNAATRATVLSVLENSSDWEDRWRVLEPLQKRMGSQGLLNLISNIGDDVLGKSGKEMMLTRSVVLSSELVDKVFEEKKAKEAESGTTHPRMNNLWNARKELAMSREMQQVQEDASSEPGGQDDEDSDEGKEDKVAQGQVDAMVTESPDQMAVDEDDDEYFGWARHPDGADYKSRPIGTI